MEKEMKRTDCLRASFTLIELLVVIGIIAILAAIIIPSLTVARQRGYRIRCASNLRQIGTAVKSYLLDNNNRLPDFGDGTKNDYGRYADEYRNHLEGNYDVFKCPAQKYSESDPPPDAFRFPSDSSRWTSYEVNGYINGLGRPINRAVSNLTVSAYMYDNPFNPTTDLDKHSHAGGVNVMYLDSHVGWLRDEDMHIGESGDFRRLGHQKN